MLAYHMMVDNSSGIILMSPGQMFPATSLHVQHLTCMVVMVEGEEEEEEEEGGGGPQQQQQQQQLLV